MSAPRLVVLPVHHGAARVVASHVSAVRPYAYASNTRPAPGLEPVRAVVVLTGGVELMVTAEPDDVARVVWPKRGAA